MRGSGSRIIAPIVAAAGLCSACCLWNGAGRPPSGLLPETGTVEVDRGDVFQVVTENGSIESSDESVVRCRVESFLRLPAGRRVSAR